MQELKTKPISEVKAKLRELLHRGAGRYVKQHNTPCPENCAHAAKLGSQVQVCSVCGAKPGEPCKLESQFKPRYTFEELKQMFKELVQNREWLLRHDRGVAMLLWVMNQLSNQEEPDPPPLPDHQTGGVIVSPETISQIQGLLSQISELLPKDTPHASEMDRRTLGLCSGSVDSQTGDSVPILHHSEKGGDPSSPGTPQDHADPGVVPSSSTGPVAESN